MTRSVPLKTADRLLRILIVLNWIMGLGIVVLLVASLVAEEFVVTALGMGPGVQAYRIDGMRHIMVLGIITVPITHVVLTRLLAIVRTVGGGDPFVAVNAGRLRTIAWSLVWLELLHLAIGGAAWMASTPEAPLDLDWNFSFTRWLSVLLLFVLAQVFEHGARMRDDLEGTV